jgi:superoxide dismutase, Cu-Zn family
VIVRARAVADRAELRRGIRRRGQCASLRIVVAAALTSILAACKSAPEPEPPKPPPPIGARLAQVGSSTVRGLVTFDPYPGGLVLNASMIGLPPGPSRIVIHTNAVCTSPNGFAAGPPFVPPNATEPPIVWIIANGDENRGAVTMRVPGLALEGPAGVNGKSAVVHAGVEGSLDAQPGLRNNRIACGVIGALQPLF